MTPQTFRKAETVRWPGQAGDFVIWMRMSNPFASSAKWNILDFWAHKHSDVVIVTNRWDDLPPWFHLHPLETAGSLCAPMMAKLAAGYEPKEPTDGPGLWRVRTGDRLVRVGVNRVDAQSTDGVLAVMSFETNALAYGERDGQSPEMSFGKANVSVLQQGRTRFKAGYLACVREGPARSLDIDWRLG